MAATTSGDLPGQILRKHGLRARKRLGQHFLRDRSYLERIMAAADLDADDSVLEIGAGTGILTEALAARAASLVALELDDVLYSLLVDRFGGLPSVHIWHGNALDFDPSQYFNSLYKVIGNIPYYVTGPIIRHFLETPRLPAVLVFMVQREVADRIVAAPGDLSLLGVSVQYYAHARIMARVPAGAFHPPPKVDSSIVRLTPYREAVDHEERDSFFQVARAGFSTRRKQLGNSLGAGLSLTRPRAHALLESAGVEPSRRAETLSIPEWEELARIWREYPERNP